MKFFHLNKYITKEIFSYLKENTKLKIIKYSKKLMEKIEISIFAYQRVFFDTLITPAALEISSLFFFINILTIKRHKN